MSHPKKDTPNRSSIIASRIKETESEIAALESELDRIPTQKEMLLAREEIDQTALDALETQEERQAKALANLRVRVSLLGKQQEAAESEEAAQRLQQIVAEAERLIEREGPALAAYDEAAKALAERAQAIAELHRQHGELVHEEVFLVERYRLPRTGVPRLGEMPNAFDVGSKLGGIFSSANQQDSPWARKRAQWDNQRRSQPPERKSQPPDRDRQPSTGVPRLTEIPNSEVGSELGGIFSAGY